MSGGFLGNAQHGVPGAAVEAGAARSADSRMYSTCAAIIASCEHGGFAGDEGRPHAALPAFETLRLQCVQRAKGEQMTHIAGGNQVFSPTTSAAYLSIAGCSTISMRHAQWQATLDVLAGPAPVRSSSAAPRRGGSTLRTEDILRASGSAAVCPVLCRRGGGRGGGAGFHAGGLHQDGAGAGPHAGARGAAGRRLPLPVYRARHGGQGRPRGPLRGHGAAPGREGGRRCLRA